ncbi:MAG TPA: protein kinase [Candidatus Kryptonia bacterium]
MIGKTISHYRIIEKLGEGGMGVVYKAEDSKLKREVAIKFLPHHISASQEERNRFELEAQAAAALNHPNIATIHAIEDDGEEVFIVMEYIDGPELGQRIKSGQVRVDECFRIIEQVASGLQAAHQKGIVHRDIKCGNVMLTKTGQVKIMDFGLAKVKWSVLVTREGTTVGTAAYMSPEQARGDKVDHRADLWSMGVIFYEMLTGKLPFKGEFEQAMIYSILNEEIEPVSSFRSDVPPGLDDIIKKVLSKDADARYQHASEFLSDVRALQVSGKTRQDEDGEKRIAVLPFENISSDNETDYFAEGLAEELIVNLSRIKNVSVVARTSSMQYKGTKKDIKTIGRELRAGFIMEGSVRRFKDDLRISVQLIDVASGTQLWGETYKGRLADVFDIQEQVSRQIVEALRVKLSPTEKIVLEKRSTVNAEAFDMYLRGRDFLYRMSKNNLQFSIQLFQKATELDTRYASAYAGLGEAYAYFYQFFERNTVWLDKAIESGLKALMYDSTLSEAYAALALAYYNRKSLDEANAAGRKAIDLDPNNFTGHWILGRIFFSTDRYQEAIDLFKKVIALNPDFYSAYTDLRMCYERVGDPKKLEEVLMQALEMYVRYQAQHPDDARARIFHATALAEIGKVEEAKVQGRIALELSPNDALMLYNGACFYARLGESKLAIESLRKALATGWENYEWMKRDSDLDSIRSDPQFVELIGDK